jgi:hypothetical protein
MDGFGKPIVVSKKSKSGSKKKSKKKDRSPPAAPIVFATEEMPEDAMLSGSEDEIQKSFNAKYANAPKGILDHDVSALHSVDLSIPVGENEHLPRAVPYKKPEEVRQYEDELAQRRRLEALQEKKDKKEKKEKKEKKDSKKSKTSKKEGADGDEKKKKGSKKSKSKEEPLLVMDTPAVKTPEPERPKSAEPEVDTSKKTKKSSKSQTKSKKSTSKKSEKAPVISQFSERSDLELVLDDNMALVC